MSHNRLSLFKNNLSMHSNPQSKNPGRTADGLGFAVEHDTPIPYLSRIRRYYQTLGYGKPYQWAHYSSVPFTTLAKPLADSRVALITTSVPFDPDKGEQGPGAAYNSAAKFYSVYSIDSTNDPDMRIAHVGYDRKHTTAEDMNCWFPLAQLRQFVSTGRIGSLASCFHGIPTNRSQATTLQRDCPEVVSRLQQDQVDAAVIVPNCPVCHQTASLLARTLEENGIASVVMGCAKDIVEYIGVPRLVFSDFPLGNAAGKPNDLYSQALTLNLAIKLLDSAPSPRTTVQSPLVWSNNADWKLDFYNVDQLSEVEIGNLKAEFDRQKNIAKEVRRDSGL